jgi:hypothetical protein
MAEKLLAVGIPFLCGFLGNPGAHHVKRLAGLIGKDKIAAGTLQIVGEVIGFGDSWLNANSARGRSNRER